MRCTSYLPRVAALFVSCDRCDLRCGPRRGGALLPKTQAAPFPRRGRQTLAITQFSKASSACVSGLSCRTLTSCLAIPHAGASRASRAEPDGRSSAVQYKTLPSSRTEVPNSARFQLFFLAFSFSCHVLLAMRPPARGRTPAQDTSRALPAARQTDTSHNSIQQSEQRLCFGIELPSGYARRLS